MFFWGKRPRSRTRDLAYEPVGGYPRPNRLPPLRSIAEYARELSDRSGLPPRLAQRLFSASGIEKFAAKLAGDEALLDELLRTQDIRMAPFSFLTLSASVLLADEPKPAAPIDRAARLIVAARDFFADLRAGRLKPDAFRNEPLEMGGYMNLFSTCIFPGGSCSRVYKSDRFDQIAIMCRGQCYLLALEERDRPLSAGRLRDRLALIAEDSTTRDTKNDPRIGALSCPNAVGRRLVTGILRCRPVNRASLDALSKVLFVLCLDLDSHAGSDGETLYQVNTANYPNRWYYSSCQIAVFGNGRAGVTVNFPCGLDGNVVMRFCTELQRRAIAVKDDSQKELSDFAPSPLKWRIDPKVLQFSDRAARRLLRSGQDTFKLSGIGRREIKSRGLKPDPVFVLSMLLALRRLTGRTVDILEHATLAAFRNMGLGLAPVTTRAAEALVTAMESGDYDPAAMRELLRRAAEAHYEKLKDTRGHLPLKWASMLNWRTAPPWRRPLAAAVALLSAGRPDAIISHPGLYDETPLVGRPGLRFPYVGVLGLHYQIRDEHIDIVIMPSTKMSFRCEDFAQALRHALDEMLALAEAPGSTH